MSAELPSAVAVGLAAPCVACNKFAGERRLLQCAASCCKPGIRISRFRPRFAMARMSLVVTSIEPGLGRSLVSQMLPPCVLVQYLEGEWSGNDLITTHLHCFNMSTQQLDGSKFPGEEGRRDTNYIHDLSQASSNVLEL